ncbi:MAG: DNA polymerase III subunit delta [Planctomycetota bacterium]|jgi:DNA polymerase-3 subunit delta
MAKNKTTNIEQNLIYVIAGKEEALVNLQCEELLNQLLEPSQRPLCLFRADPDKTPISDVLDELRTLSFMNRKKIVLLQKADDFISKNRQFLENYFDTPCPTGILILTVTSFPSNTKLAKKLPKGGKLINVTTPKAWQLPARLMEYAQETHSKKLAKTAAELLVELSGDNLGQLYNEIDKLALFANEEKTITPQHIEALIGHNRLFNVFAVIDSILTGNIGQAVNKLRTIFATDKSAEYTAIGAFAFHFRKMFNAKVLLENGLSSAEVSGKLKIWYNKENFFSQLNKLSLKHIGANLQKLAETDYEIKTGRATPQVAIEQLVLSIAG